LIRPEILPAGKLDDAASWASPALQLAPGFQAPLPSSFEGLKEYIETALPAESPVMYGMHPNAGVLLSTSLGENLFKTITEVSGGSAGRVFLVVSFTGCHVSCRPCRALYRLPTAPMRSSCMPVMMPSDNESLYTHYLTRVVLG
jgi:hypothetical protein